MNQKLFTCALILILLTASMTFSQVPAKQDTILIPGGIKNIGSLENTINGDTLAGGNRINSKRVYKLSKDQMYFVQSPILFGGTNVKDTTSTLIIVGEKGGKKPIVLTTPKDGQEAPRHRVHGSLTLKNIYWPVTTTDGKSGALFYLYRSRQVLRCEDLVTEGVLNGDLFELRQVRGPASIFFKNCYFRDNTQFQNSWNFAVFARGDKGEPIDSLWIENTTVSNSGLTFFGKLNPIKFLFFDHNTIVNTPKYVFFFDQYLEAYFTNNIFVNCNWEGECIATYRSQLPDGVMSGITNLDTINAYIWQLGHGYVPEQKDVKWLSSNNLHFTSPFLNKYYAGEYDDNPANFPISTRDWGFLPPGVTTPTRVENVPPVFINPKTQTLIDAYDNIVAENNYDNQLDPQMKTPGIASQAVGDVYAKKAMFDYGVLPAGMTWTDADKMMLAFGDRNPLTVPGIETEDGGGFRDVTDLVEDFSYNANVVSTIDGRQLGSLQWYPNALGTYNGAAALEKIKAYLASKTLPPRQATTVWNPAGNPSSNGLWNERLNWTDGRVPEDNKVIFNVPGARSCILDIAGKVRYFVVGDNASAAQTQNDTLIIANGGTLTSGVHWNGIGWTSNGTMIVESGGTVNFGEHMWVGWNKGVEGTVIINGGTINVAAMYGTAFEGTGGIGHVYVNSGALNLTQFDEMKSIPDGSFLDISGGKVTIPGNFTNIFNKHITAGKIKANGGAGTVVVTNESGFTILTASGTDVEDISGSIPHKYALKQNYPNPFNPSTRIYFSLPQTVHVTLSIYNVLGQRIKTLIEQPMVAGIHEVAWDGTNELGKIVTNGIYFYRLSSDMGIQTMKMILMK